MQLGAFSVSLAVKDIQASKRFYEKLGAKLRKEWVLTRLTGAPLRRLAR